MELPAMAMVVATVLLTNGVATEEACSGAAGRRGEHKRERACPWTLWRCNQAPRGWQLFQLVFPWLIVLVLCMPCLGVAGQSMSTMDAGCLQFNSHLSADGVMVCEQEVTCAVADGSKDSVTDQSGPSHKEKPSATGFGVRNVELLDSHEAQTFPANIAASNLVLASCMLPGWTYVQQALHSTILLAENSAEIIIQASSVHQQSVAASLDWGSNSLISISLKFLTLTNRHNSKELKLFKVFTTNTEFCALDFRESVLSPGSKLSIPIAYIPRSIGKAEGRMVLQTNAGGYVVETSGEGVPLLYKLLPLSSFVVDSKAQWQEMISLFNPFDEPILVKEAYVGVEPISEVSASYQTRGEGVLFKSLNFKPKRSNPGKLKVKPIAEWLIAPHSQSPIMDLTAVVDDGEHLVGTLWLKLYRRSVQLLEVLVVPVEFERASTGTGDTKCFEKETVVEVGVLLKAEHQSGWAWFMMNCDVLQVQAREASAKGKGHNDIMPITVCMENSLLVFGVRKPVPHMALICFIDKTVLACKSCDMAEFFVLNKLINSTIHSAVWDLCSALSLYGATSIGADVNEHRCLATHTGCTEHVAHQKCFDMPSALCKVYAVVDRCVNKDIVPGIHGHDLDSRYTTSEYHIGVLPVAVQSKLWSNESDVRLKYERLELEKNTCIIVLSSAHLVEVTKLRNKQGNDCNLLSPFFLQLKSGCAWPSFVLQRSRCTWLDCKLTDLSVSMVLRAWSNVRLNMGSFKQYHHQPFSDMDASILYLLQDGNFLGDKEFNCRGSKQTGSINIANYGSEYSQLFFCCTEQLDLPESAGSVDYYEACCVPLEGYFYLFCHVRSPLSRHQKLILKVFLLILFSVFFLLIKSLRQEKQLAADVRLRHSCSHTFFLQSVYLKIGYIKASERSSNFKHALQRLNIASSLKCQDDEYYESKLLIVMARVVGSLGSMLRWFFDSQATVLNVRVHIAESPCIASVEQVANFSRNSIIADDNFMNSVEKPVGYQTSTTVQGIQGSSCRDSTDTSRVKHFEANTSLSVSLVTTDSTIDHVSQRQSSTRSLIDLEKVHQKEKKDKGKRRKRRSNMIDLSGSSSPPSSPASPATPLAYSPVSPFLQSDSTSRSFKGLAPANGPQSNSCPDSTRRSPFIQLSSETLSQLDVRGDHAYCPASKGKLHHHVYSLGPKANLEPLSMRMPAAVKTQFAGERSGRKDSTKAVSAGENWAAVARRAIATASEPDQCQGLSSSSRSRCSKNGGPVLLPSATFPQSGRSMQWNTQMLEEKSITLNHPMSSPSLVSTSLVAPNARAPGSRPAINCNEKLPADNLLTTAVGRSQAGSADMCIDRRGHKGLKKDDFLYDIWGDHFAEISRSTQITAFSTDPTPEHDMVGMNSPALSPKVGSFFAAASDFMISTSIPTPSEGFSIFSRDAFFLPYQRKDAAGSPTP